MIKAKEDLDSLKIDYKRLRLSMRTSGLRKTSEHWRQEIREKKIKADRAKSKLKQDRGNEQKSRRIRGFNLETNKNLPTKHRYGTRAKTKYIDQKLERLEKCQKEMQDQLQMQMQEQLAKIQQDMMDKILES
ncbi:hypothetical protein Gotri_028105, partial [Gossypium trilobum]|nr:hypothetical protein [Gossypium trilobum]